jgi:glycine dehydrogenase subunit 1
MADYTLHDEKTIQEMLAAIGIKSLDELYQDIPSDLKLKGLNLDSGMSEPEVLAHLKLLADKNTLYEGNFLGAGSYYHYIPSLVDFIISRSEFYTAYTPYQAEGSQGYLQTIYEYQTVIARLTGMDVANASMYDGSTAMAEAATMAFFTNNKTKIIVLDTVNPEYLEVIKTYCWGRNLTVEVISSKDLAAKMSDETSGVIFQSPNFFGEIEDVKSIVKTVREKSSDCLVIQGMSDPTCLGVLSTPGENDIDIFVAEGQALGIAPSFGGPNLGIFAAKNSLVRKMPGRIIGKTKEVNGDKEGFVLTLQAREQHIRREKALSNICSNQALCMFATLVYLVCMGKYGLKEVATQNFQKAAYVKEKLATIKGISVISSKPTYNEFVIKVPNSKKFIEECKKANLLPPLDLTKYYPAMTNQLLVCVTEANTKGQIEKFIAAAQIAASEKGGN